MIVLNVCFLYQSGSEQMRPYYYLFLMISATILYTDGKVLSLFVYPNLDTAHFQHIHLLIIEGVTPFYVVMRIPTICNTVQIYPLAQGPLNIVNSIVFDQSFKSWYKLKMHAKWCTSDPCNIPLCGRERRRRSRWPRRRTLTRSSTRRRRLADRDKDR